MSYKVDHVCLLRKIPTRLRGTNFCTSSSRFVPSFARQPNGSVCTQVERNAPKCQFRVQWGGSGALRKISTRLRGTNFCTCSTRFVPSFVRQPNGFRMHPNSTKRTKTSVYSPMGWIGRVRCEKFRRDFVERTFAPVWSVLN